ncbi:hypothetical protein [Paenisporosarcina indica]|uniref:hypothetical protein n=1 Tax=Paenisporosarcina indica TaxID=650093 RepID=UPI00095005DE|nr:hypothetical protein [Paenisporosarcina indica]
MTDGLNYRLHQLLWCDAAITLENGEYLIGKIIFVGSNFVEILLPSENGESVEVEMKEDFQEDFEEDQKEENVTPDEFKDSERTKGRTLIFSISKIVTVESDCPCPQE